jgi:transcriptional regulator with XRE-family HTH domain
MKKKVQGFLYPEHLFGKALKIARDRKGRRLEVITAVADIGSPGTISNYERGLHNISVSGFFRVLEAIGISFGELLQICREDLKWDGEVTPEECAGADSHVDHRS